MGIKPVPVDLILTSTHCQTPSTTRVTSSQWPPSTLSHPPVSLSTQKALSAHFPAAADFNTLTFELEDVHDDQLDCES